MLRKYSFADKLIANFDAAIKTLANTESRASARTLPGQAHPPAALTDKEAKHVAGLMRVNHSGEVCAQALYQGQALTAQLENVREKMEHAALEEIDHLAWCETRLKELKANQSVLNPAWYLLSFSIGAIAGALGDKWSLGFVVETERQVTKHLESHISQMPEHDLRSIKILEQMAIDETHHATTALEAGGAELPEAVKFLMRLVSKLMTNTSYYI